MIRFYQKYISIFLGKNCRFIPTCSAYTYEAVEKFGVVKGVYLGIDQKICPLSNGGGIIGKEYDEHGNSITESIFDKDGQLAWGREGVARCVAKYNKQGRIIETANYGTDGNLCFNKLKNPV